MSVYCEDCINKIDAKYPKYWTCEKKFVCEKNFVSRSIRIREPYEFCKNINKNGNCKNFEQIKITEGN